MSTPPQTPPTNPPTDPVQAPLGKRAAGGFFRIVINTMLGRLLQVLSVLVIGKAITDQQLGLANVAIGISAFVQSFRDGGVRDLLVTRHDEYEKLAGPAFWFSACLNCALALCLGFLGEVYARQMFAEGKIESVTELSRLVWIIAAALPLGTPSTTMLARLKIDLRFRALAWLMSINMVTRYGMQIILALAGFGPLAIVLPLLAIAVAETAYLFLVTREKTWKRSPKPSMWWGLWKQTQWITFASVAAAVSNQGFIVAVTKVLPSAVALSVTGQLGFALSILYVIETTIATSLVQVMLPVLSRLSDDPQRQANAALRVTRLTALVSAPLAILAAIAFFPLQHLVFGDKWRDSALALLIMTPGFVMRYAIAAVAAPLVQSMKRYRDYFVICVANAVATIAASVLAVLIYPSTTSLAVGIAVAAGVVNLALAVWILRAGLSVRTILDALLRSPALALLAAGITLAIDHLLIADLSQTLAPWKLHVESLKQTYEARYALQCVLNCSMFLLIHTAFARVFLASQIRDALSLLPNRLANPVRSILMLR